MMEKQFPFEIKEVTEQGIVRGYAAAIGNVDDGGDKILSGAFDRSIARSKGIMPVFWGHSWDRIPIGYGISAAPDAKGLLVEGELTLNIPTVKDAYESMKHAKQVGYAMGISIGYRIPPKGYDMVENVRELKEVDVFEWSVTPFPMNKRARVTQLKHSIIDELDIDNFTERELEAYMRDAFELSAREAKTFISRLRVILTKAQTRDVSDAQVTMPDPLRDLSDRIALDRWLAEQQNRLT